MKNRLPHELPLTSAQHHAVVRRGKPWRMALVAVPVVGYFWQGWAHGAWAGSLPNVLMATLWGFLFWHAVVTGFISTNHGLFNRRLRPFAYWASAGICLTGYLINVAGVFVSHLKVLK